MSVSRQVRRAQERERQKTEAGVWKGVAAATKGADDPMSDGAPRYQEGVSPPPHPTAHPQRYPKHHDPEKGQVHGGECNVTRCTNRRAVYWNRGTFGLYCPRCAHGINFDSTRPPLCILVDEKPALEEMEDLHRNG